MNEYRCGACGATYRGFPFDRFIEVVEHHKTECEGGGNESSESEHEMSETFTASSGARYWLDDGYLERESPLGYTLTAVGKEQLSDVREFFRWGRDRELGRERDPEDPNLVWYPLGDDEVRVLDETDGRTADIHKTDAGYWPSEFTPSGERYFKLHPARPLPTALGTIIEGNGHQAILADLDDEPWRYVGERLIGAGLPAWMSASGVLELLGPDWRVIHEGMKDGDE